MDARSLIVSGDPSEYDYVRLARQVQRSVPDPRHLFAVGCEQVDIPEIRSLAGAGAVAPQAPPDPEQTAFFLISTGTTGAPKIIPRTHRDYLYGVRSSMDPAGFDADTVYVAALPLAHTFPWAAPACSARSSPAAAPSWSPSPRPDSVFDAIERKRVTATAAVPAVVRRWLAEYDRQRWNLQSLGCCRSAARGSPRRR